MKCLRLLAILSMMAPAFVFGAMQAEANIEGRRTTSEILTGLTIVAAYEKQPIAVAALALGTLYSNKRFNDDIRNTNRERGGYYGAGTYGYGDVVPTHLGNSYSQHISYKGFSYSTSGSDSVNYRIIQPQQNYQTRVVYRVLSEPRKDFQPPPALSYVPPKYSADMKNRGSEPCYSSPPYEDRPVSPPVTRVSVRLIVPQSYNGNDDSMVGTGYGYSPYSVRVVPSSYSHNQSVNFSYRGGSYGHSESSSASFQPLPRKSPYAKVYYDYED